MFSHRRQSLLPPHTAAACAAALAAIVGCGGGYEGLVPVSGTVTFDGGPPPAGGSVTFVPVDRSTGKATRPATATFGVDGVYHATSFKEGDGLFPGRYGVTVTCYKGPPDYSKKDAFGSVSYVPDDYAGQEVVVEAGASEVTLDIDVPLKKT
jgi:hypothetical protein